jgi:hypothetical protein
MRQLIAAAGTVAVLFYIGSHGDRDYGHTVLGLGAAVLIYFALLKLDPNYARAWLCTGAGLAAFFVFGWVVAEIGGLFLGRTYIFPLMVWGAPVYLLAGGMGGFYLVWRWTTPRGAGE